MKGTDCKNENKLHVINFRLGEEMLFQLADGSWTGAVATEDRLYHCSDVALKPFVRACVWLCVCVCGVWAGQCYSRLSAALNACYSWGGRWPRGPNGALIPSFLHFQIQGVVCVCLCVCLSVRPSVGGEGCSHTADFCRQTLTRLSNAERSAGNPVGRALHVHDGSTHLWGSRHVQGCKPALHIV